MSAQRKPLFGAFTYSAMLAGALAALYSGVEIAAPKVEEWLEHWRILRALRSSDVQERMRTIRTLEGHEASFANACLQEALNDPSVEVGLLACGSLADRDVDHRPLITMLSATAKSEHLEVRSETARILGRILVHEGSSVQSAAGPQQRVAARAGHQCLPILFGLLKDPVEVVRAAAAEALGEGRTHDSAAAELLAAAGDKDRGVRLQIAQSLLRIRGPDDPKAAELLTRLVADPEPVGDRLQALQVLLQAGEEARNRGMKAMVALLSSDDPAILPDVLSCLGEAGPPAQVLLPALEKVLTNLDPGTRAAAITVILKIRSTPDPHLLGVMHELIVDKTLSPETRQEMLGRLSELAPATLTKLTPHLIRQLGDPNPGVRRVALDLLGLMIDETRAEMPAPASGP